MSDTPELWLVSLFYGEGAAPTGTLAESAACALEQAGYRVTVLTSASAYNGRYCEARRAFGGRVKRLFCRPRDARGAAGRALSWATFTLRVACYALFRRPPDVVLVMTTPPFLHAVFVLRNLIARRKTRVVLWSQDTYPEILASVGLLRRRGLGYRCLQAVQRWATSRVDAAVVLDEAMGRIVRGHGAPEVRIAPNWESDANPGADSPQVRQLRELLGAARERFRYIVLYSGNYGWGHDLAPVLCYVRENPDQSDFFFLFLGGGEKWEELSAAQRDTGSSCVRVRPYVARESLPSLLRAADFGLVCLETACAGLMSPSKIHGYLAAGKPLVYLGPPDSNVDEAISRFACGWRVDPDDAEAFAALLVRLAQPDFDYPQYAARALQAHDQWYSELPGTGRIVDVIGNVRR